MADDEQLIQCKIDLKSGALEVSAPPQHFENAVEKAKELAASLAAHTADASAIRRTAKGDEDGSMAERKPIPTQTSSGGGRRRTGGSSARPGRIGSFEPVDLGLKEEDERALVKHYAEKQPVEQHEQVATAMYKGEQLLKRQSFSYNEIYTLLRLSGEKELPKALDVVVGRMIKDNWAVRDGAGYALKFPARDYVEQRLPRAAQ